LSLLQKSPPDQILHIILIQTRNSNKNPNNAIKIRLNSIKILWTILQLAELILAIFAKRKELIKPKTDE
jgi:hypothetical protein